MAAKHAERQIVVAGTPQQCFAALTDFETYPAWQDAVRDCAIESRDADGRGRRVRFRIDAKVKSVCYTLDYSYEEPHLITWDFVDGDVEDIDGEYVLEDMGDGSTLATYALRIDPGGWVPGRIASLLSQHVMQRSVEDLKARVEHGA